MQLKDAEFWREKDAVLYHGDCKEVLSEFDSNSIDMTCTSPPYDNLRTYSNGCSFDFESIAKELYRVTKPGGVVVWVVGDATVNGSESGTSFRQALYFKEIGFNLHDTMIYHKVNAIPKKHPRYEQAFEYMFVLSKGLPKTVNLITEKCASAGKLSTSTFRHSGSGNLSQAHGWGQEIKNTRIKQNIWRYCVGHGLSTSDEASFAHPATFPEALARDHILSWSNPGDTVLDSFVGSGTTLKMASLLDRKGVGIDCSAEYLEIAKKRIHHAQQQERLF